MLNSLGIDIFKTQSEVIEEFIKNACTAINPMTPVNNILERVTQFPDWYEYFNYKRNKIKEKINDLMLLNESIDVDLLESILLLDDRLSRSFNPDRIKFANPTLETWANSIYKLNLNIEKVCEIKRNKYQKFDEEYKLHFQKKGHLG